MPKNRKPSFRHRNYDRLSNLGPQTAAPTPKERPNMGQITLTIPQALDKCIGTARRMAGNLRAASDTNTPVTGVTDGDKKPVKCVVMAVAGIRTDAATLDDLAEILVQIRDRQREPAAEPGPAVSPPPTDTAAEAERIAAQIEAANAAKIDATAAEPPDNILIMPGGSAPVIEGPAAPPAVPEEAPAATEPPAPPAPEPGVPDKEGQEG